MSKSAQSGYLKNYAEQETKLLASFPETPYQNVLVIPAYQEPPEFIEQYQSLFPNIKLLIILIINQPESDTDTSTQQILFESIAQYESLWQQEYLSLHNLSIHCDVLVIKRFQSGLRIADKFGVGLARKIGADLALALHQQGKIQSPWIAFTDADALLPNNYFKTINEQNHSSDALSLDFSHQGDENEILQATKLYESGLKYYQAGLAWAGSRYAFHAVGSCLVVNAQAYAVHRGIPKRPAGEDFYLLNKIAKRGVIKHLEGCQVRLESRISERTPFGTGSAVNKILASTNHEYYYYHPECFSQLKSLLSELSQLVTQENYGQWQERLSAPYRPALDNLGLAKYHTHHAKQGFAQKQLKDDIHCWFDGLKTLQFINYMRDYHYPDVPLNNALKLAKFFSIYNG